MRPCLNYSFPSSVVQNDASPTPTLEAATFLLRNHIILSLHTRLISLLPSKELSWWWWWWWGLRPNYSRFFSSLGLSNGSKTSSKRALYPLGVITYPAARVAS